MAEEAKDAETVLFGAKAPSRFVEFQWIKGGLAYAVITCPAAPGSDGALIAQYRGEPVPSDQIVKLCWPASISRGGRFRPFWWQLVEAPHRPYVLPDASDTLFLVLSPEVDIVESIPFDGGRPGYPAQVNIQLVRTHARHQVPQAGEPCRPALTDLVRTAVRAPSVSGAYGYDFDLQPSPEEMTTEQQLPVVAGTDVDLMSGIDHAVIERSMGSARIWQDGPEQPSWRVEITQEPADEHGSFSVEVHGLELPEDSLYISHYRVRIVACGAVSIRAYQAPFKNLYDYAVSDPNPHDKQLSHVDVEVDWQGDPAAMPATGWRVEDSWSFRAVEPANLDTTEDWLMNTIVTGGMESVPVVGSFIEFGGLFYAAAYGRTWYGEEVTDGDLVCMGVFALLGILPGVSSTALKRLKDAGEVLAPAKGLIV